jgi:type II secretory pathway pseudopilin PulG
MRFSAASGVAIGPILFVIALLAILATAIAAGSSTFSSGTEHENARVAASAVLSYAEQVRTAVARMLALGVRPTALSFSYPAKLHGGGTETPPGNNHNNNCTTDECEVFSLQGGGLLAQDFTAYAIPNPSGWQATWRTVGSPDFAVFKMSGLGTSDGELVLIYYNIQRRICDEINNLVGYSGAPSITGGPHQNWGGNVPDNVFSNGHTLNNTNSKITFCKVAGDGASGVFYAVLIVN